MRSLLLVSAAVLSAIATPAAARNGAWYVGGDFGAMIVDDINFDIGDVHNAVKVNNDDFGFDGSLFVGYDLGAFRLEAEVAYKTVDVDSFETEIFLPSSGGFVPPGKENAGGSSSALSFMINGMLDFGDEDGLSGFVGGGAGIARVDYNNIRAFANHGTILDDGDTRFAWQVIAGVRQAVSDNIDVTLRYRFFNVGGVDVTGFDDSDRFRGSRFRSHSLLGGITYNFGAPPPPPPPPPPQ